MRRSILVLGLLLAACASPSMTTLVAADAATTLAVGERLSQSMSAQPAAQGADPVVNLTLRHTDGRSLSFQQGNHTATDLAAQRPGGALAQIMGVGEEATTLYHAASDEGGREGAFFCAPEGPAAIGTYQAPDGTLYIVGLKQQIQFETLPNGALSALPYSPDQVCARLRFRRG